ncbi:MAG: GNAT family N-acetyltransferase [Chlamydiales bacterium]
MIIKTERLLLRPWQEKDIEPFYRMNADERVMKYFPKTLTWEESNKLFKKISTHIEKFDWGLWAVELPEVANFIGFIGLSPVSFTAHFTPSVEIGWRLAYPYWGQGYATEGALAALRVGFEILHLLEIVSFTAKQNKRSIAVMKKIGMHHNESDDFDHPKLTLGNILSRHVLYRLSIDEWKKTF